MNYEVKEVKLLADPVVNEQTGDVAGMMEIISNCTGNTYPKFYARDVASCAFLMSDTGTQMKAKLDTQAAAWVAANYPNT